MLTSLQLRSKTFNFAISEEFLPVFLRVLILGLMGIGSMPRFQAELETILIGKKQTRYFKDFIFR